MKTPKTKTTNRSEPHFCLPERAYKSIAPMPCAPGLLTRLLAVLAGATLAGSSAALATNVTWDSDSTVAGVTEGAGSWSTSGSNWYSGGANAVWNNSNNDIAYFSTSGGTGSYAVTLGENITAGGLFFNSGGATYTIGSTATTANPVLTLTGLATISAAKGATLYSSIAGTNGITINANNGITVTLYQSGNNSNTYTGNTTILNGTLQARGSGALPKTTTVVFNASTGTGKYAYLELRASQTVAGLSNIGTGPASINQTQTSGTTTLTVNPDGAGAAAADSTFSGTITEAGGNYNLGLTKAGSHMLTLTGVNTYTGTTSVTGGTLQIGNGVTGSLSTSTAISTSGTGVIAFNQADGSEITNAINNKGGVVGAQGSGITNTLSGIISNTGSFTQTGAGTTILSNANTYTGATKIMAGETDVNGSLAAGSAVTVYANATLGGHGEVGGTTTVNDGTINGNGLKLDGVVTFNGSSTLAGTATATSGISVSGTLSVTGTTGSHVTVNTGANLKGTGTTGDVTLSSGSIIGTLTTGTIGGTGLVSPGTSSGILTAASLSPANLSFAFEFTLANNTPAYGNAAASGNDILRLTDSSTPFSAALDGNVISIYLSDAAAGERFIGGFFTNLSSADLYTEIKGGHFVYYVANTSGDTTFNGTKYSLLDPSVVAMSTIDTVANFGGGNISGSEIEFTLVPEPSAWALMAGSLGMLAFLKRMRRSGQMS